MTFGFTATVPESVVDAGAEADLEGLAELPGTEV